MNKKQLLLSVYLVCAALTGYSQTDTAFLKRVGTALNNYALTNPHEKIYLQLDKPAYNPGDTIWFKAYELVNGTVAAGSGVLHVELINNVDSVLTRLNLRLEPGITWGDLALEFNYPVGYYRLRAYTSTTAGATSTDFFERVINVGQETSATQASNLAPANARFYPEGGNLIIGLRTKVAIKIVDGRGVPVGAGGAITDNTGLEITKFTTAHGGLGVFALTPAAGKKYTAVIKDADGSKISFDLPLAQPAGFSLTVNNWLKDTVYVKIVANADLVKAQSGQKFYLLAHAGDNICYSAVSTLGNNAFGASILKSKLPAGLVQFTLFSSAGKPLNSRMIFNDNADTLKIDKAEDRQQHLLNIAVKNNQDKPVNGSFSVAVTRETTTATGNIEDGDILPYLQLLTDLKQPVDEPGYYFAPSNNAKTDLDMLLLTQENKSFSWNKVLTADSIAINRQGSLLALEGFVKATNGKPLPNTRVSVYCILQGFTKDTVTDNNGHFKFNDLDIDGNADIVVKAQNPTTKRLNIYLKEQEYPGVGKLAESAFAVNAGNASNDTSRNANINITNNGINNSQPATWKKTTQLKQVEIKAKKTPKPDKSNNYGASDPFTVDGSKFVELGARLTLGLVAKLPGVLIDTKNYLVPLGNRPHHEGYHIVIDDQELPTALANQIDSFVSAEDVEDVKVLEGDSFKTVYNITDRTNRSAIILITTKRYAGTAGNTPIALKKIGTANDGSYLTTVEPSGIINYHFAGYSIPHEFKASISKATANTEPKTVYWQPNLITDTAGKATLKLTDLGPGMYKVTIEGIDTEGKPGRLVYRYKVD